MSLLIDALRKAEQAKRDAGQAPPAEGRANPATASGNGSVEPPARPPKSAAAADLTEADLSTPPGSAYVHSSRVSEVPSAAAPDNTDGDAAARDSVRVLFDAKAAPAAPPLLPIVAAVGTLGGLAIAAWVWWGMQPHGSLGATPAVSAAPAARSAPTVRPPAPSGEPALVATVSKAQAEPPRRRPALPVAPPAASSPSTSTVAQAPAAPTPTPSASSPRLPAAAASEGSAARPRSTSPRGALAAAATDRTPPPLPPAPGLGPIRRGSPPSGPPPKLIAAYAAYGEGRLDEAERLYREVLAESPLNRDAINGLAATALREGRSDEAERWFRRALALDRRDPVAVAGLASLTTPQAPTDTESRLKNLLAATPDAAPAHFALGNALAVQQRWSEAQQAYFRAYALDGDNPDYLFNLAVSLDHLGQGALASRFYGEALEAAARRPAAFDPAAAGARRAALTPP